MSKWKINKIPAGIEIRYTEPGDAKYLKEWLMEPGVMRWFPMDDEVEIDDAVNALDCVLSL